MQGGGEEDDIPGGDRCKIEEKEMSEDAVSRVATIRFEKWKLLKQTFRDSNNFILISLRESERERERETDCLVR